MARDFDNFPVYDPVIKAGSQYLSGTWSDFFAAFVESLQGYLSQNGIFIPSMTTDQRNALISPQEGQMIYLTDAVIGPPRTGHLEMWQVVAGVGQWTVIV